VKIRVRRYDPLGEPPARWETFELPPVEGENVLGVLQRIRETLDSTLAFRYGCRFKGCGLCTVEIDGRPLPACIVRARNGMEVSALGSFPVLRDLVIDRAPLTKRFAAWKIHLVLAEGRVPPARFEVPPSFDALARCTECLACLADCPSFPAQDGGFAGPLGFVKLAQLHFDPRDDQDRRAQAKALGVTTCLSCRAKCSCPIGVPIRRSAIEPLL
jgi:succinate dehydrogenase / fumarate reductase iron-sulfur subunit